MDILSNGIQFSSYKPGKEWKFFRNYKVCKFGIEASVVEQIEHDLYMDNIPNENARIYFTKEGKTSWAEVYIKF